MLVVLCVTALYILVKELGAHVLPHLSPEKLHHQSPVILKLQRVCVISINTFESVYLEATGELSGSW